MSDNISSIIKEKLVELADEKYREFHSKLCPNTNNILGVRVPVLRNYAKELIKEYSSEELLKNIDNQYYEEIMLQGMVIGLSKEKDFDIINYTQNLSKQIASFLSQKSSELEKYQTVKVYYDNGQIELTKILTSVFSIILPNVEFRKVLPKDYKLFQVADLFCTMELLKLKKDKGTLTQSDTKIFGSYEILKRNYLKPISKKEYR